MYTRTHTHTHTHTYIYIYIIIILSHCLHRFPWLSPTIHLYYSLLPVGLLDCILCPYRAVVDKFELVTQHLPICVKRSRGACRLWVHSYFSSSVQDVLFVLFGWSFEMRGWWPYSSCFVECCFQSLFIIACSILMQYPFNFLIICFVSVHVVHPYSRIDTTAAWKKLHFISLGKFDFHMIDNLSCFR